MISQIGTAMSDEEIAKIREQQRRDAEKRHREIYPDQDPDQDPKRSNSDNKKPKTKK